MTKTELQDLLTNRLGICGCGSAIEATSLVFDVLETAEMRSNGMHEEADETLYDTLSESSELGGDVVLYWLHGARLVDHGDRLDGFTISPLGEEVLEALRDYGPDGVWFNDDDEPSTVAELVGEPDRRLN